MTDTIQDRAMRYIQDSLAARKDGERHPQWSMDDLDEFREYVNARFSKDDDIVLHVYDSIVREFNSGHRCGVCGRTSPQSAAIGYNCAEEC